MTAGPLVSVIIPCKDADRWLAAAIEACLRQTWGNLEIIVVDNGSADGSLTLARHYRGPRVSVFECARPGASAARNTGLAQARGDFIQFLDADDLLHPGKIRSQLERLATAPPLSVASGAWARFRDDPYEVQFAAEPVWRDLAPTAFLTLSWCGGGMMPNFAWLAPRAVVARAGDWDERLSLGDDGEFFSRVVLASSGIAFCGEARGYYRSGPAATVSRRRDRAALRSAFLSAALSCDRLLRQEPSAAAANACAAQYQRFAFDAYLEAPDLAAVAERRAARLGGSDLKIGGGPAFQALSRCLGWRAAKRCQRSWHRLRAGADRTSAGAA